MLQLLQSGSMSITLVQKVISQTRRRILKDESVPTAEKVYSLFEPHSYVVLRVCKCTTTKQNY